MDISIDFSTFYMHSDSEDLIQTSLRLPVSYLPFLFGLMDDALIVGLSRLGCQIEWLKVLTPIVMTCTIVYLLLQVYLHGIPVLFRLMRRLNLHGIVTSVSPPHRSELDRTRAFE